MKFRKGFTLAEVLITLVIIGVVSVLTIPTLISKINDKVDTTAAGVFNAKMVEGLNLTKLAGNINDKYHSTYDFLDQALSKNLKMAKICDANHIRDCFPYDTVKYELKNGTEDSVQIKDLKTAKKLKLTGGFEDTAAFVLADGTPVLVSYNLDCPDYSLKEDKSINGCLAGIYDLNGSRKPNKFGTKIETDKNGKQVTEYISDVRSFNGATIESSCIGKIGGLCIATPAYYLDQDSWYDFFSERPTYVPSSNRSDEFTDNYAVAQKICEDKGHLPNANELAQIATALYYDKTDGNNTIPATAGETKKLTMKNKDAVFSALGITYDLDSLHLWSSVKDGTDYAYARDFYSNRTTYLSAGRSNDYLYVVCIGE